MTLIDSISVKIEDTGDWIAIKDAFKRHNKSFSDWIVTIAKREFTNGGWSEVFDTMEDLEKEK